MNINISKDTAITLAAWVTVIGFLSLFFGQVGEMRADIKHLREDNREIRQILISHLEFHGRKEKIIAQVDDNEQ